MYTKIKAQYKLTQGELALVRCQGYGVGFLVAVWDGNLFRDPISPQDKELDDKVTSFVSLIEAGYADPWNGVATEIDDVVIAAAQKYLLDDQTWNSPVEGEINL